LRHQENCHLAKSTMHCASLRELVVKLKDCERDKRRAALAIRLCYRWWKDL